MPNFSESTFFCFSQFGCSCIKRPIESEILGPYVEIDFTKEANKNNSGSFLTVSNKSSPPNNTAFIKSFQFGQSDGTGAELEIYDEEGGSLQKFVSRIVKTPAEAAILYQARVRWGWITQNCDGTTSQILSRYHWFNILSVDMSFTGNGITFKLGLSDTMTTLLATTMTESYPDLTLKAAIKKMFSHAIPPVNDVVFKRFKTNSGRMATICNTGTGRQEVADSIILNENDLEELKFKGDVETKPTKGLAADNETPLAAARRWVRSYRSEREDKGIIIFYDSTSPTPRLIFLEDPLPRCFVENSNKSCNGSIGTYIVGGGKHSPVISFNPTIKYNFSYAARGNVVVSPESAIAKKDEGLPCKSLDGTIDDLPGFGIVGFVQLGEDAIDVYGSKDAAAEALISAAANEKANKTYESVEAELKIQGDPRLDDPLSLAIRNLSIIVINPFHLRQEGGDCPGWLVSPPCNPVLSNKNWFISGVSHEIKEGSYTTTLKLKLPNPGKNLGGRALANRSSL